MDARRWSGPVAEEAGAELHGNLDTGSPRFPRWIGRDLAAQLRADSAILGLSGRTEIVKAALALLHQRAAEERMARSVDDFYAVSDIPLPIGVNAAESRSAGDASAS